MSLHATILNHHAYLISGDPDHALHQLKEWLAGEMGFPTRGNPDFWCEVHETFGIDEARSIRELHLRQPLSHDKKIIVIGAQNITFEAQNALLKTFEEPAGATQFFIIFHNIALLLPTLRSRCLELALSDIENSYLQNSDDGVGDISTFLQTSLPQRIKLVEPIIKERDIRRARRFIDAAEELFYQKFKKKRNREYAGALGELARCRRFLAYRGSSPKLILEHLAMVLPER